MVTPGELGAADFDRWRSLRSSSQLLDSPFLDPHFTACVGEVRSTARVAVLSDGNRVVGFFPHEVGRGGIGRPIGAGLSDYQAVIVSDDAALEWPSLLRQAGLWTWQFDHLAGAQAALLPRSRQRHTVQYSPALDLTGGYDAYRADLRQRSKTTLQNMERKRRKLNRDVGPVEMRLAVAGDGNLERLMRWKSLQYRQTGRRDRFASPSVRSLLHHLMEAPSDAMTAELQVLMAGDRPLAWHFGLRSSSILAYWFPAYDREFAPFSPGAVLLLDMARAAADAGCHLVDLGKGDEEYKLRFANTRLDVLSGHVASTAAAATMLEMYRAPREIGLGLVLGSPRIRRFARSSLRGVGRLRTLRSEKSLR